MAEAMEEKASLWATARWVCPAGAAVGAFFGLAFLPVGPALGGLGGIVAGIVWSWWLSRRILSGKPGLIWGALGMGVVVGLLATAILHVGIPITDAIWHWIPRGGELVWAPDEELWSLVVFIGVFCGITAGAITGLACGALCLHGRNRRTHASAPPA